MTFCATFLLHTVSRSCSSWFFLKARGSHVQNVIQTPPVLLDVVGCRMGRQLSVVVMVNTARVYMLSLRFLVSDGKVDDHGFVAIGRPHCIFAFSSERS